MTPANDNAPATGVAALNFFSVCSGIEAASVAWNPLGWRCVGVAEIEKFPSAVLAHHYPDVHNHGDFTKIDAKTLGRIDILCGGTPCQAFSVAGARGGLNDARGNLTLSFVGLAHELAGGNGLRNAVWENVPGVLSDKTNAFGCFLAGIVGADAPLVPPDAVWGECTHFDAESYDVHRTYGWQSCTWPSEGMVEGPRARAAWRILDAQYFGLAQRRRRVIVVADFGNGSDPAAVLFERAGLQGNHPPSRETREGVAISPSLRARANSSHRLDSEAYVPTDGTAPTMSARTKGGGGLGTDLDLDGGLIHCPPIVPQAMSSKWHKGASGPAGDEVANLVAYSVTGQISHALKAEGADASEDGTGRGTPIVCIHADAIGRDGQAATPSRDATGVVRLRDPGMGITDDGTSYNLMASGKPHAVTVALRGREGGATAELGGDVATALRASSGGGDKAHVLTTAVRRLMPEECEALQGFKRGYTNIPWRGTPTSPDGPRYKALGNSWATTKFRWLGERIQRLMPPLAANDNNMALRDVA